jgi:hypothetical protein
MFYFLLTAQYVLTVDGLIYVYMSSICSRLKFNVYHIKNGNFVNYDAYGHIPVSTGKIILIIFNKEYI